MSRIIKSLIENLFIGPDTPLELFLVSTGSQFDIKLMLDCPQHTFYSINKYKANNAIQIDEAEFVSGISYCVNAVVCTSPFKMAKYAIDLSNRLHAPLIFLHHEDENLSTEHVMQMGQLLAPYINCATSSELAAKLRMFNIPIQNQLNGILNELLYIEPNA